MLYTICFMMALSTEWWRGVGLPSKAMALARARPPLSLSYSRRAIVRPAVDPHIQGSPHSCGRSHSCESLFHHPGRDLRPRPESELAQDVGEVVDRRPLGDHQRLGDLPVGETVRDQSGHLALARRE